MSPGIELTYDPFPLPSCSRTVVLMQRGAEVAILVLAVAAASCTESSSTDPGATSSTSTTAPPSTTAEVTTEAVTAASSTSVPLASPARIDPVTGRWFKTDLGLDGARVTPGDLIWDGAHFYLMQRWVAGEIRVWRSVDGLTWNEMPALGTFTAEEGGPYTLLSSGDTLVAGGRRGDDATVWLFEGTSPWREVALGGEAWITSLAMAGSNLVAFGTRIIPEGPVVERHARLWVSPDSTSWTDIDDETFGELSTAVGVVPFEGGVLAAANRSSTDEDGRTRRDGPLLMTSNDGLEWETLDSDIGEVELRSVSGGDEIRLHTRSSVLRSEDGLAWTELPVSRAGIVGGDASEVVSWFMGHAVVTGGIFREHERFGRVMYPAAWTYIGGGTFLELGSSDEFTTPGVIGPGVSGGDRFVANGRDANDELPDGNWALYTFVIELPVDQVAPTWVNQTGLGQLDPAVWAERLDRACAEGVWDDDVAYRLADEFIAEDLPLSIQDGAAAPPTGKAAQALWLMAVDYCRADFPAGEIDDGMPMP